MCWVASVVAQTELSADDRADREVDAATGDHERHADADHADDGREPQDRQDVVEVGEPVPCRRDSRRCTG